MLEQKKLTGYPSVDKPWLRYYSEEAFNITVPKCTIYQNIYEHNKKYLQDIALLYFGKKITYKQMFREIDKAERAFIYYGVQAEDNVALCVPATPEAIYSVLALNKIGANAVLLNPLFTEQQLIDRISETDATLLIVANELYERVKNLIPRTSIKTVVSFSAVNSLGVVVKILKKAKNIPNTIPWNQFIYNGKNTVPSEVSAYQENTPAIMVYSSGTTGASKGIQLTNDSINHTICEGVQIGFPWKRGDRWFSQIPIWFSTGICAQTLVPLRYGITIILEPLYDFELFYRHILKYKPNFMITACGLLDYLMTKKNKAEVYKEFKFLCAGGEYVTDSAEKKYNEWLTANDNHYGFFKGYGMCECGGTVTASSPKCNVIGSAGIPTPNVVVAAFDLETDEELTYGKRGEIRVLSPCRMLGYYKNPEATAKFFHTDEQGRVWACTGDMGYVTEDGCVYVSGRITESYQNAKQETIYLFDIERTILKSEDIRQCRVITAEIDGVVTHIANVVMTDASADCQTVLKNLFALCEEILPVNHLPYHFKVYEDHLPVAPSGKLDVNKMRENCKDIFVIDR